MIRAKTAADDELLSKAWAGRYGSASVVSRGLLHDLTRLAGLVSVDADGALRGAITWRRDDDGFEIVTLDSFQEGGGIGGELLTAATQHARRSKARRIWLVTTNDNTPAIRFYQRSGWNMAAIHAEAMTEARKLKPQIPLTGYDDIPIRHEIEFELILP